MDLRSNKRSHVHEVENDQDYVIRKRRTPPSRSDGSRSYSSMGAITAFGHDDYAVGWICGLPLELRSAQAMLDDHHPTLSNPPEDDNVYTLGRMGVHNVVITCLPSGVYGTTSAATVAIKMRSTFKSIRYGLMVGIGGGAPSISADIRLGDVVVSNPTDNYGGVVPYDFGKATQGGTFVRTGTLNKPPQALLKAISKVKADYGSQPKEIIKLLSITATNRANMAHELQSLGQEHDKLFDAQYNHIQSAHTCAECDQERTVTRPPRFEESPVIHYGLIASANQVMKDALIRDRLAQDCGILCFEMEAAGIMDHFPCVVIRGICDYSDSHKNSLWQSYASATAAAYAKLLLSVIPETIIKGSPIGIVASQTEQFALYAVANRARDEILDWISEFYYQRKYVELSSRRIEGTGQWFLDNNVVQQWLRVDQSPSHLIWCRGDPGTGKSVLASLVIDHILELYAAPEVVVIYHFFDHLEQTTGNCLAILRSLLRQICNKLEPLPLVITNLYNKLNSRDRELRLEDVQLVLQQCIDMFDRTFIVVDALDEATQSERSILLPILKSLATRCNIIVTSRPHQADIGFAFQEDGKIEITAEALDIQLFLQARMASSSHTFLGHEEFVKTIIHTISNQAQGLFLLAVLQVENILNEPTVGDAIYALSNMTDTLQQTFEKMLGRLTSHQSPSRIELATKTLAILTYVRRPMSSDELCDVLSVKSNRNHLDPLFRPSCATILDCCGGLVVLDQNSSNIHLLHFSLQEFIQNTHFGQEIAPADTLGKLCLAYLRMENFSTGACRSKQDIIDRLRSYPFYSYAARFLGNHVNGLPALIGPTLDLFWSYHHRAALAQILTYNAGLREYYWEEDEAKSNNPLTIAANYHMHEIACILLDHFHIPVDSPSYIGTTALIRSSCENDFLMVKMLLARGADPYWSNWYGSTLHCVAEAGHSEMMEFLLDQGLYIDFRDDKGRTPLHCALQKGHTDVVKVLLRRGATADARDYNGRTPLGQAINSGLQSRDARHFLLEHLKATGMNQNMSL